MASPHFCEVLSSFQAKKVVQKVKTTFHTTKILKLNDIALLKCYVLIVDQGCPFFAVFLFLSKEKHHKPHEFTVFRILCPMRRKGLEPSQDCSHQNLNLARLPFRHLRSTKDMISQVDGKCKYFFEFFLKIDCCLLFGQEGKFNYKCLLKMG